MLFFAFGTLAFILFYLYDFNLIYFKTKIGKSFFLIGSLFLAAGTIGLTLQAAENLQPNTLNIPAMLIAVLFLILEIYTLFFALPVKEAYSGELSGVNRVCNKGMYALCRHPGVLWFAGFYLFLALAFGDTRLYQGACLFTALDFIYIVLQDLVIFPRQFSDYDTYKETTPFLIPGIKSIKSAFSR